MAMTPINSRPPYYANERWPGAGGLRVPQEAGFATLDTYSEYDMGTTAGTITLTPKQAAASLITVTPTANMTIVFPGPPCQAGKRCVIANLAAFTVTCQIAGNSTNTAVVPASTTQGIIQTGYNNGMALVA